VSTDWLAYEFLENPVSQLLRFAAILLIGLIFKKYVSHHINGLLFRLIKKRSGEVSLQQFRDLLTRPVGLFITLIIIYLACLQLQYPPSWQLVAEHEFGVRYIVWKMFQISIIVSLTWVILRLTDYFGLVLLNKAQKTPNRSDDQLVSFFKEAIKVLIVILSLFFTLGAIFELNVASLIAGLGIGGIAIALAAKDTLENLLGSFTIFLDKPFIVGDVIKSGTITGTVERIGFRSTLVRTADRTLVTVPNRRLVDTEVENISQRGTIRAIVYVLLHITTTSSQLDAFLQLIRDDLDQNSKVEKESVVRLERFTETGIEISIIFHALTEKHDRYTKIREDVMLRIMAIAAEQGIALAVRQ
jgi:MscS family membrane protein